MHEVTYTSALRSNTSAKRYHRDFDPLEPHYVGTPASEIDAAWEELVAGTSILLLNNQRGSQLEVQIHPPAAWLCFTLQEAYFSRRIFSRYRGRSVSIGRSRSFQGRLSCRGRDHALIALLGSYLWPQSRFDAGHGAELHTQGNTRRVLFEKRHSPTARSFATYPCW